MSKYVSVPKQTDKVLSKVAIASVGKCDQIGKKKYNSTHHSTYHSTRLPQYIVPHSNFE